MLNIYALCIRIVVRGLPFAQNAVKGRPQYDYKLSFTGLFFCMIVNSRDEMPKPILRTDVLEMKDLKEGMVLKGTVRNVIDFGVFVDIGVHQDGLVHISQITDRYIKHPLEAVSVGDIVDVKVMSVDLKKKRIQLTMRGI